MPDEREERIKEILEHPLETEADWREVAKLIDDDAEIDMDKRDDV
jgi:hypothetical protein